MPTASTRLHELIAAGRHQHVVVLGDLVADEFVSGQITRVSREAPVLIVEHESTEIRPGAAGNAAANVAALGGTVTLVALAGRDDAGRRVLSATRRLIDTATVLRPAGYHTPTKTRILAGGVHSVRQQVLRLDRWSQQVITDAWRRAWLTQAMRAVATADAVLLSDYGSGLLTPQLVAHLMTVVRRSKRVIPVLVDSRHDVLRYQGLTACTPNQSEVEAALGVTIGDDRAKLERAGRTLLTRTKAGAVLITRGSRGMSLFERGVPTRHIPIYGTDEVADVTGAGDTVMATLTLALSAGATMPEAARLANYAGGLVVMKRGTATVSSRELADAVACDSARADG